MDSEDESRPGSSASNSSDSSDDNNSENPSRPSSPEAPKQRSKSGSASPQSGGERAVSRVSSRSSRAGRSSSKSNSGSTSSSSSSSSSSDEEEAGSAKGNNKSPAKPPSSRSSSEESGAGQRQGLVSRNQSISPVRRKSRSSRNSSASSAAGSLDENREDGAINMSHEDLSDVSEMDCEKRQEKPVKENSKLSIEDEGTNGSVSNTRDLAIEQDIAGDRDIILDDENARSPEPRREPDEEDDENDGEIDESNQKSDEKVNGKETEEPIITDLRQKLDLKKAGQLKASTQPDEEDSLGSAKNNGNVATDIEELVKKHDEDALDFEAEEGECPEVTKEEPETVEKEVKKASSEGEAEEGEELEEGEVSDEDEKRPEETEPKPVCRFYTRGQCTWGMSCRFLHPGVTDKGNYTMFDMVRPVPVPSGGGRPIGVAFPHDNYHDYRTDRPPLHHRAPPIHHHPAIPFGGHHDPRVIPPVAAQDAPVVVESSWERGLRTAKEMMRKANKRKELDMDFEDKKMNLTLSPDDVEKDNYYIKDRSTPPEVGPQYPRHQNYQEPPGLYTPPERFARGPPPIYDDVDPYGRSARYRELPPHRMPQYEDERRVRPAREVIVQRVEPQVRGDEWNDPWMRSKSPVGGRPLSDRERSDKRRRDRRSYSSNSSYSSSSSSPTDSSSESSRSPSPDNRRRYNSGSHKTPPPRRHFRNTGLRSPSPRRARRSPSIHRSPVPKRRGHSSPSPLADKRAAYSPSGRKRRVSPSLKKAVMEKGKKKRRGSSSSGSDSSGSGSDSSSSSSESSSQSRAKTPVKRVRTTDKIANERKAVKKVEAVKKRSPISIEIKKPATVGASALTSPSNSNSSEKPEAKDMKKTRREELLKQLRAVEDAIAKKKSKLA